MISPKVLTWCIYMFSIARIQGQNISNSSAVELTSVHPQNIQKGKKIMFMYMIIFYIICFTVYKLRTLNLVVHRRFLVQLWKIVADLGKCGWERLGRGASRLIEHKISYLKKVIRGRSRIPCRRGRRPSGGGANMRFCQNFRKKLHEIKKMLGRWGSARRGCLPKSATGYDC